MLYPQRDVGISSTIKTNKDGEDAGLLRTDHSEQEQRDTISPLRTDEENGKYYFEDEEQDQCSQDNCHIHGIHQCESCGEYSCAAHATAQRKWIGLREYLV